MCLPGRNRPPDFARKRITRNAKKVHCLRWVRMFNSFFFGGFECTTGYNREGEWIDLVVDTWHHEHAEEDYRRRRGT